MPRDSLWRPWDQVNFNDPYPMYARLQQEDPLHLAQTGEWIITRYDDVKFILKDPRFKVGNRLEWLKRGIDYLNNQTLDFQLIAQAISTFMLFLNPPQHTRVRKFVSSVWTSIRAEEEVKRIVRSSVQQLPRNGFDLVRDFAEHVPASTMACLLGISGNDYKVLQRLARELSKALDLYISVEDLVTIHEASSDFVDYFRVVLKHKNFSETGLIFKLLKANQHESEPLSENELISTFIFLFTAGEETTSSLIGTGVANLLRNAPISPTNWDIAIDELLRYEPPVQLLGRIATEDVELGGRRINKGSTVTLCVAAANRDPAVFAHPHALDLNREQNRHLAFGSGIHFCMGDWLGRLEGKQAIRAIVEAFPHLRLSEDELTWSRNLAIRSLSSLPVVTS